MFRLSSIPLWKKLERVAEAHVLRKMLSPTRGCAELPIYLSKGAFLRLNVSREPLFVFEFVETLFAFE